MMAHIHSNRFARPDVSNMRGNCTYLPRTTFCATPDETEESLWLIDQQRVDRIRREPQAQVSDR